MKVIMLLVFLPLPVIMAVLHINETRFKKNIVIGVTLPYEAREDEEVKSCLRIFKRQTVIIFALLTAGLLLCLPIKGETAFMEAVMCWMLFVILLSNVPYILCNKRLKKIKHEKGWSRESTAVAEIDTASMPNIKWLSPWWFVLAITLNFLPLIWERDFIAIYTADAICAAVMWLIYRWAYRNKSERVDGNAGLTQTLSRVRKRNWGNLSLLAAYSLSAFSIIQAVFSDEPTVLMAAVIVISFILIAGVMAVDMNTRRLQEKLTRESGRGSYIDDDDKWIWGMFYYNPSDSKLCINSRVGTNVTVNLAKPAGKLIGALGALIILAVPFIIPFSTAIMDKPPELLIEGGCLSAGSGRTEYTIKLEDIKEAELMDELPEKLVKINGTGMESLLKGKFSAEGLGSVTVCLDPGAEPFLLIETENEIYLLGSRTEGRAEEIYQAIK